LLVIPANAGIHFALVMGVLSNAGIRIDPGVHWDEEPTNLDEECCVAAAL
jgi:hypothetical protein